MQTAELVFARRGEELLHLRLDRAETSIGSHPTNDVVVPEANIPDVAAVLIDHGGRRFGLRDMSDGGVLINEARIQDGEAELKDGDQIQVGSYSLRFRVREGAGPSYRHTQILGEGDQSLRSATLLYGEKTLDLSADLPFNLGSDESNDLVVEDPFTSSFHCRISCREGRWTLVDLASTNGTKVNGLKVGEAELPATAKIQIGQAELHFSVDATTEKDASAKSDTFGGMIGQSAPMQRVFELCRRMAGTVAPVLITGASGSGKELVARSLHDLSNRASGPFLAINCGALASSIIESELFGHQKGAFTGAIADRKGAFEATQDGTLFLDEIGELPLELQPKLLRVLEASSIRRVGGILELPVNTRIIAATHRNLKALVIRGDFREDLFHRLFVLNITIPSLSDRKDDVLPIARHFLSMLALNRRLLFSQDAEQRLLTYHWPGNVRELRNVILRAALLTDGGTIEAHDLEFSSAAFESLKGDSPQRSWAEYPNERERVEAALAETGGNRAEAARILGLSKSTFHDRLRRLGLPTKGPR